MTEEKLPIENSTELQRTEDRTGKKEVNTRDRREEGRTGRRAASIAVIEAATRALRKVSTEEGMRIAQKLRKEPAKIQRGTNVSEKGLQVGQLQASQSNQSRVNRGLQTRKSEIDGG